LDGEGSRESIFLMIFIRRANASDASVISFMGKQTFTETFAHLFTESELKAYLDNTFNEKKLAASLSKPGNIFGMVFFLDKPVGYYKLKAGSHYDIATDDAYAQLQKIYVLKDYLGLKLGKYMIQDIYGLPEVKVIQRIWLVVLYTNARAIKFYGNQGFYKLKKYFYIIGEHRLEYELMIKKL
jgi:diamine N-acetyltransferase